MLNYAGKAGEAGDVRQQLTIVSRLARRPTTVIWRHVRRGANYVIVRGRRCTMQARLVRQATTVDDVSHLISVKYF